MIDIQYIPTQRNIRIRNKKAQQALKRTLITYAVLASITIIIVAYTPLHTVLGQVVNYIGDLLYAWKLILDGTGLHL